MCVWAIPAAAYFGDAVSPQLAPAGYQELIVVVSDSRVQAGLKNSPL